MIPVVIITRAKTDRVRLGSVGSRLKWGSLSMMRDAETPNFFGKLNQTTCHGQNFAHEFQGVTAHSLHYADLIAKATDPHGAPR